MTKLIKAEWYRLRHSGSYFKVFVIFCLLVAAMSIHDSIFADLTVADNISGVIGSATSGLAMFISTVVCASLGAMYSNRTAYYEIMDGNKTSAIILSKVFVYVGGVGIFYLIPQLIILCIEGFRFGIGEDFNIALYLVMFIIVMAHIISTSVLHSFLFRNMLAAAFPYARFICFEIMGMSIFPMIAKQVFDCSDATVDKIVEFFSWFPCNQLSLMSNGIDKALIIKIVISFIVEFGVIFALAFRTLKRKNFKK